MKNNKFNSIMIKNNLNKNKENKNKIKREI